MTWTANATAPASTALWPVDWSQMVPDIVVAALMGVIVGLVVLGAERSLERRREGFAQAKVEKQIIDELLAPLSAVPTYDGSSLLPAGSAFKSARRRVVSVPNLDTGERVLGFWPLRVCCESWERLRIQAEIVERLTGSFIRVADFHRAVHRYYADPEAKWNVELWVFGTSDERDADRLTNAVQEYCRVRSDMESTRESFVQSVRGYRQDEEALWKNTSMKPRTRRKLLDLSRETSLVKSQIVSLEGLTYRQKRWGSSEND